MEETQLVFAQKLEWTKSKLKKLIKRKHRVTANVAIDLADTLGTSPKLWMNIQATWDLDQAIKSS